MYPLHDFLPNRAYSEVKKYPIYDYLPDGTSVGSKNVFNNFCNRTPNYVNLNGSHNSTFEKSIIGSHKKVVFGRRIITGFAYYAYFLLGIQCAAGLLMNDFSVKYFAIFAILLPLVVFVITEAYMDIKTNMFSMTSIMSELIMRSIFKKYNAINAINESWNQTKHRDMSSAIRREMSDNRDNIIFVYTANKTRDTHMKLTHFVISPSMENLWAKIFPSVCKKFSVVLEGGVVHSIHSVSIGTPYSVVSTMDFTICRDNMFLGLTKYIINTFSSKNMKDIGLPTCEKMTYSIHDKRDYLKTKYQYDDVNIKTWLSNGVTDYGFINISGNDFHVCFEVNRAMKSIEGKKINYKNGRSFELI